MSLDPHVVKLGQFTLSMDWWTILKDTVTLAVGGAAAIIAARGYNSNAQTRRAEFICRLHKSFFEDKTYRKVRQALEVDDEGAIEAFVLEESDDFTDFLNFFELVAYLHRQHNLSLDDVEALLGFYFLLLCRKPALRSYIHDRAHGFEELERLLGIMESKESGGT